MLHLGTVSTGACAVLLLSTLGARHLGYMTISKVLCTQKHSVPQTDEVVIRNLLYSSSSLISR
jgi:hypothetical protein